MVAMTEYERKRIALAERICEEEHRLYREFRERSLNQEEESEDDDDDDYSDDDYSDEEYDSDDEDEDEVTVDLSRYFREHNF